MCEYYHDSIREEAFSVLGDLLEAAQANFPSSNASKRLEKELTVVHHSYGTALQGYSLFIYQKIVFNAEDVSM